MKLVCRTLVLALWLGACASLGPNPVSLRQLVPGKSTMADVEAKLGAPAEKLVDSGGEAVWFYPTAPQGRETWAARSDRSGGLVALERRLTKENLAKVLPGKSTKKEVRELLGPPWKAYRTLDGHEEWDYRVMVDMRLFDFLVQSRDDGVVHKAYLLHDPIYDAPSSRT
jgi:outer membrane protein assembly factor BamE (lipoprotein component of BamABCDE complex)